MLLLVFTPLPIQPVSAPQFLTAPARLHQSPRRPWPTSSLTTRHSGKPLCRKSKTARTGPDLFREPGPYGRQGRRCGAGVSGAAAPGAGRAGIP